ncbi:MAG TPA: carboxypeptidase-like regulatory domain-containing protein, partial [Candidatus Kapabacteria bacterium]|nr:carboxypeptidase-like regulatory domain-containing protein [Candidatus Kapabacteria bacterium]
MKIRLLFLFAAVAISGCNTASTNSPQSASTGELKGIVGLYDTHGNKITDRSGVVVKAEGTSITATSDASGHWVLHDLPTQTYELTFSKDGYSTMKNTSYSFVGGGTVLYRDTVYLCQPVDFTITLDSASITYNTS